MPMRRNETIPPRLSVYLAMEYPREDLAVGVARYARLGRRWSVYQMRDHDLAEALDAGSVIDGVLVLTSNRHLPARLAERGVATVSLSGGLAPAAVPAVVEDNLAVGRLAARYFIDRGYRSFAFSGMPRSQAFSNLRREGFARQIAEANLPAPAVREIAAISSQQGTAIEAEWIRRLPKPLAVLACNDIRGGQLMRACERIGIMIPEEVAVLGVDNFKAECELMDTPMSSIALDHHRHGFEAARLLDQLLTGESAPGEPVLIPPIGVVERQSTDMLAVADPVVASAMRFIRSEHHRSITVDDMAEHVAVSRRSLERRFREALNRSPREELVRFRIERARRLLRQTELSITAIAEACGFPNQPYFTRSFLRVTGQNPSVYRREQTQTQLS